MPCDTRLSYSNNTSSMLRHLRAKHGEGTDPAPENGQQPAVAINPGESMRGSCIGSLMSGVFYSIFFYIILYLAVTRHYISQNNQLATLLLGAKPFSRTHTAAHIAAEIATLMAEWGLSSKIRCIVTDSASNMNAAANALNLRHCKCIAHCLNLIVENAIEATPGLEEIRAMSRRIASYFKQLGRGVKKLNLEVDTRWNSTFEMLQRLHEERDAVAAALASLNTDVTPLTNQQHENTGECIKVQYVMHNQRHNYSAIQMV